SGAWASIEENMVRLNLHREVSLESFFSVAQMAIAGFGHGLVPAGVASTLGVDSAQVIPLADHGLTRPVRFVARKSMFARNLVRSFYTEVAALAAAL
ncbi:MAG: LysR substrate-binding domain-containing protein, partial [Pseudomonadota bacterium]